MPPFWLNIRVLFVGCKYENLNLWHWRYSRLKKEKVIHNAGCIALNYTMNFSSYDLSSKKISNLMKHTCFQPSFFLHFGILPIAENHSTPLYQKKGIYVLVLVTWIEYFSLGGFFEYSLELSMFGLSLLNLFVLKS